MFSQIYLLLLTTFNIVPTKVGEEENQIWLMSLLTFAKYSPTQKKLQNQFFKNFCKGYIFKLMLDYSLWLIG